MNPKIIKGLLELARNIGRWVVKKIARRAVLWLVHYMQGRVEVFMERHRRARSERRKRWLKGRISRWLRAIDWLRENVRSLQTRAARAYCRGTDAALAALPLVAAGERFRRVA